MTWGCTPGGLLIYAPYVSAGVTPPAIVGYGGSTSGNPTTPAGSIGNLLIAYGPRNSATPATVDSGGWSLLGTEAHATASLSLAVYTKTATGTASGDDPIAWTNATGQRGTWRLANAEIDTINFSQGANNTTVDYEAQPTMTAASLLLTYLVGNAAQTDIATAMLGTGTPLQLLGFNQRAARNTSLVGWCGDGGSNTYDTFDPGDSTLDTASNKVMFVISIKAAT